MTSRSPDAFPFPTSEHHPSPPPEGAKPSAHAPVEAEPKEPALDHGIEESFPASDPVSVDVTKLDTAPTKANDASPNQQPSAHKPSALRTGLIAGAFASVASTMMLALRGRSEVGSITAPTNATSHWLWERKALAARSPSWRYTGLGYVIHHGSATFWALLYAWLWAHRRPQPESASQSLASAGVATAAAFAIDYAVTPKRFTPGFEHHLSKRSMAAVYATFAVGLAVGCAVALKDRSDTAGNP